MSELKGFKDMDETGKALLDKYGTLFRSAASDEEFNAALRELDEDACRMQRQANGLRSLYDGLVGLRRNVFREDEARSEEGTR